MLEKLNTLKTILGKDEFVLTGSMALAFHGLLELSEAKDLDLLVVNPSSTTTEILKRFQEENPSPKYRKDGPVNYSFIYEGVKVDVWVLSSHQDSYTYTKEGIQLASIKSIVKAKINIGRSKDWIHLMQLAKRIFNEQDFQNQLSSISNHSEGYDEII